VHLTALTSLDFGRESTVTDETLKLVRGAVLADSSGTHAGLFRASTANVRA